MTVKKNVYIALSQFCETDDQPRRVLQEAGFEVKENKTGRRIKTEEMFDALKDADAVVAGVEPYDALLLARLPKLKLISRCGIGTDALDLNACKERDIKVSVTVDEIVEPVAQMALGMILALARNFPKHGNDFQNNLWKKHTGAQISEWTIGLIGFGRIARKLEEYLRPLAPKILVCDPHVEAHTLTKGVEACSPETLLSRADLVSLHAARASAEGVLLGKNEFAKMKRGSFLVNTARGYLIDEKALELALKENHLAGAALDVFEQEPYQGPLAKLPNVLLTPHVATLTHSSRAAMERRAAQNVVDFFKEVS